MTIDRVGVLRYPVEVNLVGGAALQNVRNRVNTMEREVRHLATAVADIRNALSRNDSRLLASGVMNSRNWTLSCVMSHCYIQGILLPFAGAAKPGPWAGSGPYAQFDLWATAASIGANDGLMARPK